MQRDRVNSQEPGFKTTAAIATPSSIPNSTELSIARRLPPAPLYRSEGSGPLLIYIAGLDGTGELFFKQVPQLASSFRVITFRQRDDSDFSYEDIADDVAAIIGD